MTPESLHRLKIALLDCAGADINVRLRLMNWWATYVVQFGQSRSVSNYVLSRASDEESLNHYEKKAVAAALGEALFSTGAIGKEDRSAGLHGSEDMIDGYTSTNYYMAALIDPNPPLKEIVRVWYHEPTDRIATSVNLPISSDWVCLGEL